MGARRTAVSASLSSAAAIAPTPLLDCVLGDAALRGLLSRAAAKAGVGLPTLAVLAIAARCATACERQHQFGALVGELRAAYPRTVDASTALDARIAALQDAVPFVGSADYDELIEDEVGAVADALASDVDAAGVAAELLLAVEDPLARSPSFILEVSGRAGGLEASLFAGELFNTYAAYAQRRGWRFQILEDQQQDEAGGEGGGGRCARVKGPDVFMAMMHEIGVHRVQRVPVTEAAGRMQTSTAAVTLLPEFARPSIAVKESDVVIEMARGGGPGGQGVNSSSNAVRLKHIPSGINIHCHASRSGTENRALAMQKLEQMLWKEEMKKASDAHHSVLKSQWTTGERADRIRTYNFPQARISDQRTKAWACPSFEQFLADGAGMEELHAELAAQHAAVSLPSAAEAALRSFADVAGPAINSLIDPFD